MAIVTGNLLTKGLSGRFGDVIFKVMRGKTFATKVPQKTTSSSELQKGTRIKFKEAAAFAKAAMLDSERKAYYKKKAIKLKLPNAYTAALTDYMRKPKVELCEYNRQPAILVEKNAFDLKRITIKTSTGDVVEAKPGSKAGATWMITIPSEMTTHGFTLYTEDMTGQIHIREMTCKQNTVK